MTTPTSPVTKGSFVRLQQVLRRVEADPATANDPIRRMFVFDGEHLSANVSILYAGDNALHVQPFHDELVLIVEGECSFRVGQDTSRVQPGDLVCIPRGTIHGPIVEGRPVKTLSIFAPFFTRGRKNILWARDGEV